MKDEFKIIASIDIILERVKKLENSREQSIVITKLEEAKLWFQQLLDRLGIHE